MDTKKRGNIGGSLILALTAAIWGVAFIAQSIGGSIGAFSFQGIRCLMGAIALLPVIFVKDFIKKKSGAQSADKSERKDLIIGGLLCGLILFIAGNLQQFGLNMGTSPGKSGFITPLYIIIIPFIELAMGKKAQIKTFLFAAVSVVGLYLLCAGEGLGNICIGDLLTLGCSLSFAFHILVVDHFSVRVDCVKMSCIQFFVCGALSLACALIFESPTIDGILENKIALLYAGIMSCAVAYTLQMIGQKSTPPTIASMVMSLESVFAMISNIIYPLISTKMEPYFPTPREIIGCVVILGAIFAAQIPSKSKGVSEE
ncbi:MAG: DMT family transporter [Clostridiales bacterium]|nr:DMT family transporter [Clostridiales bacterium]